MYHIHIQSIYRTYLCVCAKFSYTHQSGYSRWYGDGFVRDWQSGWKLQTYVCFLWNSRAVPGCNGGPLGRKRWIMCAADSTIYVCVCLGFVCVCQCVLLEGMSWCCDDATTRNDMRLCSGRTNAKRCCDRYLKQYTMCGIYVALFVSRVYYWEFSTHKFSTIFSLVSRELRLWFFENRFWLILPNNYVINIGKKIANINI